MDKECNFGEMPAGATSSVLTTKCQFGEGKIIKNAKVKYEMFDGTFQEKDYRESLDIDSALDYAYGRKTPVK